MQEQALRWSSRTARPDASRYVEVVGSNAPVRVKDVLAATMKKFRKLPESFFLHDEIDLF